MEVDSVKSERSLLEDNVLERSFWVARVPFEVFSNQEETSLKVKSL